VRPTPAGGRCAGRRSLRAGHGGVAAEEVAPAHLTRCQLSTQARLRADLLEALLRDGDAVTQFGTAGPVVLQLVLRESELAVRGVEVLTLGAQHELESLDALRVVGAAEDLA